MADPNPNFLADLFASLRERVFGSKVTTIAGILVGVGGSIAAFSQVIPPKYQTQAAAAASLVGAVALALSHDTKQA